MKLFIKVKDNQIIGHPMTLDDVKRIYNDVTETNLPNEILPFIKTVPPVLGIFEVQEAVVYEIENAVVKEKFVVRDMTSAEKEAKISISSAHPPYPSWTFNPGTCGWDSPVSYPQDGQIYKWDEELQNWVNSEEGLQALTIRNQRNQLLFENVDTINPMRWESMTEQQKNLWRVYRQELLDVPQQKEFPWSVTWPKKPME